MVESKRLGQVLRVAQQVQQHRDNRVVRRPSTAHRADGTAVPTEQVAGSKRQRELGPEELERAMSPQLLPPCGRQTALLPRQSKGTRADIST